jgi:oligopeptide/dipeptide ABC transporter ATP-binding protein
MTNDSSQSGRCSIPKEDPLLQLKDLHTYFYTHQGIVKAVCGISLSINRGETVALVGESGCGKSVTARSIMRLVPKPHGRIVKGRILFDGHDLLQLNEAQMRHIRGNTISMVFQEPMTALNPVLRIDYQISETLRIHQGIPKNEALHRAAALLEKVGISDPDRRAKDYPHLLSGGMRQRVMIAIALSCNPKLIIADEPTTALDVTIQAQILALMNQLKRDTGASILLITHDLGVVARMAQSVAVMYAGRIVESTDVITVFTQTKHPYTVGLMNSIPKMDGPVPEDKMIAAIPGVVPSLIDPFSGCRFSERCSKVINRCTRQEPPLTELKPGHLVRCWHHVK